VLNVSNGFEEKSKNKGCKQNLYIYATSTPFKKIISKPTKGVVRYNGKKEGKKLDGKKFCTHCKKSFIAERFYEHVFTHQSNIKYCDEFNETFRSTEMLKRHQIRSHEVIMKCFRCDFRGTVAQFHRSHMEECCGDLFNEENELSKEIIKNNNFMIEDE
jgi:hypothetical protein